MDIFCACGRKIYRKYNSTIVPRQCPSCTLVNLTSGDTQAVTDGLKAKSTRKATAKSGKSVKTPHKRFYTSTAWKWFSRYVLLYYSIDGVAAKCATCGNIKRLNDKELHTGHWIKVFSDNNTYYSTAFEFTNLGPQCSKCNRHNGGHERLMQIWLTEKHGAKEIERLQILSKHPFRLDDYTLSVIALEYRTKFNELLKTKGWSNPWKK